MSTINICEYCNSELKTKHSLKKHQNYNKKCLEIQSNDNNSTIKNKFECEFCNKDFTSNYYLNHHLLSSNACKIIEKQNKLIDDQKIEIKNQNNEIQKLLSKIEDLQKQNDTLQNNMKEIVLKSVSTPKIVNNNNNNKYTFLSTFNLTKDEIKNTVQKNFTENHFLNGQEGVAEFTYNNLLIDKDNRKLKYYCNDPSRKVFTYIDDSGNLVKDIKSKNLTKMIACDVIDKSKSIMTRAINKTKNETEKLNKNVVYGEKLLNISNITSDNSVFTNALTLLTSNKEANEEEDEIIYYDENEKEKETEEQKLLRYEYEKSIYTKEYFINEENSIKTLDPESPFYVYHIGIMEERKRIYLPQLLKT